MKDAGSVVTGMAAALFGAAMMIWIIPSQTVPAIFASVPSGFYPNFTCGLLTLSGLGLIVAGFISPAPKDPKPSATAIATRFVAALVLLVGAMYLTPFTGFLVSGVAICLVTLLLMGETRWILIASICVVAPLAVWGGFEVLLGRPLP